MRILLDECVNEKLRHCLPGHECQTVRHAGFGKLNNGALLDAAEAAKFDVLLTVDCGMEYQQDLSRRTIAVMILQGKSIQFKDLLPLMETCLGHPKSIRPGQVIRISG